MELSPDIREFLEESGTVLIVEEGKAAYVVTRSADYLALRRKAKAPAAPAEKFSEAAVLPRISPRSPEPPAESPRPALSHPHHVIDEINQELEGIAASRTPQAPQSSQAERPFWQEAA